MRAARYLKVPMWDLEDKSVEYRDMALLAQAEERGAKIEANRQQAARARREAASAARQGQ